MEKSKRIDIPRISLRSLLSRFRWRIIFTMALVLAGAIIDLLFPLFIGFAINGLLVQDTMPLVALGALGVSALVIGSGRRFYDTRAYAGIYTIIATEMVANEQQKETPLSGIAARATLLTEFVEFLENSLPMIVTSVMGVVGVLIIILSLNTSVFWAALALLILMIAIYVATGRWNFEFNKRYNDQLEEQVDVLSSQKLDLIETHFKLVMRWNIRLSDLETFNYVLIWLGIIALLVYSPVAVIDGGEDNFGTIFSTIMYVFQYIDAIVMLPFFIQQIIRLQEISARLSGDAQDNLDQDHGTIST